MDFYLGVDVGAFGCAAALLDEETILGSLRVPSGTDYSGSALALTAQLLRSHGVAVEAVRSVVATGVGARRLGFADAVVGEVICTARGAASLAPEVRTVIDVGSQSTRVIWLDGEGRVAHFTANEKCATGSGRFLQVIANVLRLPLEEVGPLSLKSENPVRFTTGCAVFGESEAITRVSEGVPREDILAGVHRSLAEKILMLLGSRGIQGECGVCGGGALDVGLLRQLEHELGRSVRVLPDPLAVGAVGAAIQARRLAPAERLSPEERWVERAPPPRSADRRRGPPTRIEPPPRPRPDHRPAASAVAQEARKPVAAKTRVKGGDTR